MTEESETDLAARLSIQFDNEPVGNECVDKAVELAARPRSQDAAVPPTGRIRAMSDAPRARRARLESTGDLAAHALTVVSTRNSGQTQRLETGRLAVLEEAVSDLDRQRQRRVVQDMLDNGIEWVDIAETYIPEIARRLGARWCEDKLGFAEVTIASARLQSMLRELLPDDHGPYTKDAAAASVAVVVMEDASHTLGAMVLTHKLRRCGISAGLVLGQSERELIRTLETKRFDAIFISSAAVGDLDPLRKLVKRVRVAVSVVPPIVVGGPVLELERDVKAVTGADHATSNPEEALDLCGLTIPSRDGRRTAIARQMMPRARPPSLRL